MIEYPMSDPLMDLCELLNNYSSIQTGGGVWFNCMHRNGEFLDEGIRVAIGVPKIRLSGTELSDVKGDISVSTRTAVWSIPFKFTSYCEEPAHVHAMNWVVFMSGKDFRNAIKQIGMGFNDISELESFIEILENRSFNTTRFVLDVNVAYRVNKHIAPVELIDSVVFTIERVV
jgi:hypothetical protein